jgi:hypothetical protein
MPNENEDVIRVLAKQAYRHRLLVKALRSGGYLRPDQPDSLWDAEEFEGFLKIFRANYFPGQPRRIRKPRESGES